jgi:Fur family zinc uptake transcriptional regulator
MGHDCDHEHNHDQGLHGAKLKTSLAAIEHKLSAAEQRLTAPRKRVLELMLAAGQPVKAYDLMAAYGQGEEGPAKPPTVYRALEFLERQGLIHRIQSLNAYVVCRIEAGHDAAFLICDCCGATEEVEPGKGEQLAGPATKANFQIKGVTIEAHGLCAECR